MDNSNKFFNTGNNDNNNLNDNQPLMDMNDTTPPAIDQNTNSAFPMMGNNAQYESAPLVQEPFPTQSGVDPFGINSTTTSTNQVVSEQPIESFSLDSIQNDTVNVQQPIEYQNTPIEPMSNPVMNMASPQPSEPLGPPVISTNEGVQSQNTYQTDEYAGGENNPSSNTSYTNQYQGNNNYYMNDDELVRAYIGKNYEKISTRPFNFSALFFTNLYMFYRKMFLYGIILYILMVLMLFFTDMSWILNIVLGLCFNKLYLFFVKRKVAKIKAQNPQKSFDEIKGLCAGKGGTSVGRIFLGILAEIAIGFAIIIISLITGVLAAFGGAFGDLSEIFNIVETNTNYNGGFSYDNSVIIANEFAINIPNRFEEGMFNDESTYNYEYTNNTSDVFKKCSITFSGVRGYSSVKNLFTQMSTYYANSNASPLTTKTINNITWYTLSNTNGMGTTYFYGTEKDDEIYVFQYEVQKDASSDCLSYKDQVLNSITPR